MGGGGRVIDRSQALVDSDEAQLRIEETQTEWQLTVKGLHLGEPFAKLGICLFQFAGTLAHPLLQFVICLAQQCLVPPLDGRNAADQ